MLRDKEFTAGSWVMSFKFCLPNFKDKFFNKKDPQYSTDWFSEHIANWSTWLSPYKDKPDLQFLEIGSYEGRSSRWLLENILTHPTSRLYCIDLFDTFYEWLSPIRERFNQNIQPYQAKVSVYVRASQEALRADTTLFCPNFFDFIYIDGSHESCDVLEDAVLSFRILKEGGILIFDDYELEMYEDPKRNPKPAIDAWLNCFEGQYELLHKDWQVCVRKL
jgi:SAM-dependent methyltransferase